METLVGSNQNGSAQPEGLIKDSSDTEFVADVIEASKEIPIIVDFWAPWCGPCKQLGPTLEKVVSEAAGAVKLVKIDIDQNPQIAQQLRVQSIPAVYAFYQGRPVDGFQGALPESQLKEFVKKLTDAAGSTQTSPIDEALEQAKVLIEAGDNAQAEALLEQILQHAPDNAEAKISLARLALDSGQLERAQNLINELFNSGSYFRYKLPTIFIFFSPSDVIKEASIPSIDVPLIRPNAFIVLSILIID